MKLFSGNKHTVIIYFFLMTIITSGDLIPEKSDVNEDFLLSAINNSQALSINNSTEISNNNQQLINEWETRARATYQGTDERRNDAVLRLKACLEFNCKSLDLWYLNLSQLPAHLPYSLQIMNVSYNQLTQLPEHRLVSLKE